MENAHLSWLYATAFHYISNVGSKLVLIRESWNYDDPIAQTNWYKPVCTPICTSNNCIDFELNTSLNQKAASVERLFVYSYHSILFLLKQRQAETRNALADLPADNPKESEKKYPSTRLVTKVCGRRRSGSSSSWWYRNGELPCRWRWMRRSSCRWKQLFLYGPLCCNHRCRSR